jgi:hyperosmotically inducible protein
MKNGPMKTKYRETLISGVVSVLLMTGLLALLIISGYLFAPDMDARIESTARQSHVFKTFLEGDEIQIRSQDGAVTLTGTVAEEPHLLLAADTVANLPGVKSVDNRLKVRAYVGPGRE